MTCYVKYGRVSRVDVAARLEMAASRLVRWFAGMGCKGGVLDRLSALDKKALFPEHRVRFWKQGVLVSDVRLRPLDRFRAGAGYWASAAFFAWACTHVMAMTPTMSCALQPRDRSLTGAAMPWVTGPNASAWARRCTSL